MNAKFEKFIYSLKAYYHYLMEAFIGIYLYYASPFPMFLILKKLSLAHRKIRIIWAVPSKGRPPLDEEIIKLIIEMKSLNPKWGAKRISNELLKIGYKASKKSVLKYLELNNLNTPNPIKIMRWSEFLNNHSFKIGIDFTSLISFWGHQLFILVILDLDSRKLIFINATFSPHREWITQQFRNAFMDLEVYPTLCICDRDQSFSIWFKQMMMDYYDIKVLYTPIKTPWNNGKVERFHLSLKKELFDDIVPLGISHTQHICLKYQKYYNQFRTHQGINGKSPQNISENILDFKLNYKKVEHLSGKFTTFESIYSESA
jgi:putative transposase